MSQSPSSPKRRRPRRKKGAPRLLRRALVGSGVVFGLLALLGFLAWREQQQENAERSQALRSSVQVALRPTPKPLKPPEGPVIEPPSSRDLSALKPGMAATDVQAQLGAPDTALGDHRFVYRTLHLDLTYRMRHGRLQLATIRFTGHDLPPLAGFGDLPPLEVGGSSLVLRQAFPDARIVYHRDTNSSTLYDSRHHLVIDFTPDHITGIRQEQDFTGELSAALGGPHSFGITFEQAFDSEALLPQMLTDSQIAASVAPVPKARLKIDVITMRLKVDTFSFDDLKDAIKRQVNLRVAAGDMAAQVTVYARNGSKIVVCDWYAPNYEQLAGHAPKRIGDVDENDIGYRWY